MTKQDKFDEWVKSSGITLSTVQSQAAHALLDAAESNGYFYAARATGVTFTHTMVEEFLKGRPRCPEVPKRIVVYRNDGGLWLRFGDDAAVSLNKLLEGIPPITAFLIRSFCETLVEESA